MRRLVKVTLLSAGIGLLAIQVVRPSRTNPPEDAARTIHAVAQVDPAVTQILNRSCKDCHSSATIWPWYSQVAPASWLLVSDVRRGRRAMNLSEWAGYTPKQQLELLEDTCEEASKGEMPQFPYVLIHAEARLSAADRQTLCAWTRRAGGAHVEEAGN